ncbi:hypothetical protein BDZ97DRAFT_1823586, partial [Flammula alnicola]
PHHPSLLPKLPKDYKVVLLKNEFGDVQVDSKLAQQSSLLAVSEILNGCMCCVLVGQMQTALLEIRGAIPRLLSDSLINRPQITTARSHYHRVLVSPFFFSAAPHSLPPWPSKYASSSATPEATFPSTP